MGPVPGVTETWSRVLKPRLTELGVAVPAAVGFVGDRIVRPISVVLERPWRSPTVACTVVRPGAVANPMVIAGGGVPVHAIVRQRLRRRAADERQVRLDADPCARRGTARGHGDRDQRGVADGHAARRGLTDPLRVRRRRVNLDIVDPYPLVGAGGVGRDEPQLDERLIVGV